MSTKTTRPGARLFYVLDIEALFLRKSDYTFMLRGDAGAIHRTAEEEGGRYEIYTSRRELESAIRYYITIM